MAIAEAQALPRQRESVMVPVRETLGRRVRRHWTDYLYVLPALLVMLVVIGYPLVYTVWLSFHATPPRTGEWVFNGAQNYQDILSDPRFCMDAIVDGTAPADIEIFPNRAALQNV